MKEEWFRSLTLKSAMKSYVPIHKGSLDLPKEVPSLLSKRLIEMIHSLMIEKSNKKKKNEIDLIYWLSKINLFDI